MNGRCVHFVFLFIGVLSVFIDELPSNTFFLEGGGGVVVFGRDWIKVYIQASSTLMRFHLKTHTFLFILA